MKTNIYNITYNPAVYATENGGYNTIKGTGIQIFQEYGENERGEQTFKRILDKNKNIIGEYKNLEGIGNVGNKQYKTIHGWMKAINKQTGCNVF